MKKSNLDHLLEKYMTGRVTPEEKAKIEAWLELKKTKGGPDAELTTDDEDMLFSKIKNNLSTVDDVKSFEPEEYANRQSPSGGLIRTLGIAASICLLIAASYAIYRFSVGSVQREITTIGQDEKIKLEDETLVWLKKGSILTFRTEKATGMRLASLTGEGLFEVAKDAEHPFVISCGEISVKVVGTSFSLKSKNGSIDLKVLTGKVSVSSGNSPAVFVAPNERLIYSLSTAEHVQRKNSITHADVEALTINTDYNMRFSRTRLDEVLKRIEKKFDVKINSTNPLLADCRITGDFTDQALSSTLSMISELLDFKYAISGSEITVSGNGCR